MSNYIKKLIKVNKSFIDYLKMDSLPDEMIHEIYLQCSPLTQINMSMTCHKFYNLCPIKVTKSDYYRIIWLIKNAENISPQKMKGKEIIEALNLLHPFKHDLQYVIKIYMNQVASSLYEESEQYFHYILF